MENRIKINFNTRVNRLRNDLTTAITDLVEETEDSSVTFTKIKSEVMFYGLAIHSVYFDETSLDAPYKFNVEGLKKPMDIKELSVDKLRDLYEALYKEIYFESK